MPVPILSSLPGGDAKAMSDVPQKRTASSRALKRRFSVRRSGNLQDKRAVEMQIGEVFQKGCPFDSAISRGQMVVELAAIVAGMHHPEMTG